MIVSTAENESFLSFASPYGVLGKADILGQPVRSLGPCGWPSGLWVGKDQGVKTLLDVLEFLCAFVGLYFLLRS